MGPFKKTFYFYLSISVIHKKCFLLFLFLMLFFLFLLLFFLDYKRTAGKVRLVRLSAAYNTYIYIYKMVLWWSIKCYSYEQCLLQSITKLWDHVFWTSVILGGKVIVIRIRFEYIYTWNHPSLWRKIQFWPVAV